MKGRDTSSDFGLGTLLHFIQELHVANLVQRPPQKASHHGSLKLLPGGLQTFEISGRPFIQYCHRLLLARDAPASDVDIVQLEQGRLVWRWHEVLGSLDFTGFPIVSTKQHVV